MERPKINTVKTHIIDWLLEGDPAIRWQALRNLTVASFDEINHERAQVETTGWGKQLLSNQDPSSTWANGLYTPKWTSTTYTLLLLRRMGINPNNNGCQKGAVLLLNRGFWSDGGINLSKTKKISATCITGMVFGIISYFNVTDKRLVDIFNYLVENQMSDGGWNCQFPFGATHASFHTTLIVLEALYEFSLINKTRLNQIMDIRDRAHEFLLKHKLFQSHRTGKVVDTKMTRLSFPPRWRYNILSALDYFQAIKHPYDERFSDSIQLLKKKEKDGKWPLQQNHKGKIWFEMEMISKPSRWNTLRAIRVLKWWNEIH